MKLFIKSNEQGAESSIFLATADGVEKMSGGYVVNCKLEEPDSYARDLESAERMWELSLEMCDLNSEVKHHA